MKIEYASNELKKMYKTIANAHTVVYSIVDRLPLVIDHFAIKDKKDIMGKVVDITNGNNLICITILVGSIPVDITIYNKKIKVSSIYLPYKVVYDDYFKRNFVPIGYEYQNKDKILLNKYLARLNPSYANTYLFKLECASGEYSICIDSDSFNKNEFIQKLLYNDTIIHNFKDLMLIISKIIDLNKTKIKISDKNNNRIIIDYGNLTDYIEYRKNKDEEQKVYLDNNEIYVERKIHQKEDEETTSYIKKIGVYNGKEKKWN